MAGEAEAEVFAQDGVFGSSEPLSVDDPALTTRVVRYGRGPATVLLHGASMTATAWAPLLPHLPDPTPYLIGLPGCSLADPFDYTGALDTVVQRQTGPDFTQVRRIQGTVTGDLAGTFPRRLGERCTPPATIGSPLDVAIHGIGCRLAEIPVAQCLAAIELAQ